ncbi:MAG TPA: 7,8-didemethyl-8-hydroxy-5-deazariboflavin synthase subunit CofH [Anaerolineae bacterium]|nr:5-amino-6-(D-ribitylamino)uracil--L-tyrosine 4-hydroxyphenyl transferase CofH [Caldilineae bacterium]HID35619.1 7,8-didemethyl-8-hydroxy-5-deazariboflavin synthase subunit CofH [Anaerolineae bacterium]
MLEQTSPAIRVILENALEDRDITPADAARLFRARGRDAAAIIAVADALRRRQVGDRVTYVQTRNINFTNICYTGCAFCAFGLPRQHPNAYAMDIEEVVRRAVEARRWGCTEVCMQGGLNPLLGGDIYVRLVRAIKAAVPDIHIHAFSPFELQYASQIQRRPVREVLLELKEAGLGSIPGTAAEILIPDVRQALTKNKLSAEAWIEIVTTAHEVGLPSTATIMYGHIDGPEHWAAHLAILRDIQRDTGGFTEFVPLGFIYQNTRLYASGRARPGPTGRESALMHAVARIMLGRWIPNIQVSWVKLGLPMAQMLLEAGANDFGGTLHNESISRSAGAETGEYVAPAEFERLILDLGRTPAQRDTTYRILHEGPRYYNPNHPATM